MPQHRTIHAATPADVEAIKAIAVDAGMFTAQEVGVFDDDHEIVSWKSLTASRPLHPGARPR